MTNGIRELLRETNGGDQNIFDDRTSLARIAGNKGLLVLKDKKYGRYESLPQTKERAATLRPASRESWMFLVP